MPGPLRLDADGFLREAGNCLHSKDSGRSGGWWGRWGVNYVYGTWQVLVGLRSVGQDMTPGYIQRAVTWLRQRQKPDGSFGETCRSYDEPSLKGKGQARHLKPPGEPWASWLPAGADDPAARSAIDWLIEHQATDGNWAKDFYTGTGFPKVFYLKYHLYRLYFPLMALGRYRRLAADSSRDSADSTLV